MKNLNVRTLTWLTPVFLGLTGLSVRAQLPVDFPGIIISNYNPAAVGEGKVFLAVASETPGIGTYLMILENDGTPVWYEKLENEEIYDFKVAANGYTTCAPFIHPHDYVGGGDVLHQIRNEAGTLTETVTGAQGYVAESHDFHLQPNGNILQFGYYLTQVDMSPYVDGGYPAALVSGGCVQELDAQRNVVWQWRTWDAYDFDTYTWSGRGLTGKKISQFHLNDINLDPDGNLILGTPSAIWKVNRQTGEIMWILGGDENQFAVQGAGADVSHFGGHATYRIPNGNFLMYDNGNRPGTTSSKVHEYTLDEVNKIATHVWSWEPPVKIGGWHRGNAQRLPNGNTMIGWGGAAGAHIPVATEVTPAGDVVWELYFAENDPQVESYRAFRFPWPPTHNSQRAYAEEVEVAGGTEYPFNTPDTTGVSVDITSLNGGDGYNEMYVLREPYAPVYPSFTGIKPPRVLPVRVVIDDLVGLPHGITADVIFNVPSFGFTDPGSLTVMYRSTPGSGPFSALPTSYNDVKDEVTAGITEFGELIFAFPDLPDVAYPPILCAVENYRGVQTSEMVGPARGEPGTVYRVNQDQTIRLSWSPKGFARGFAVQVDDNADFSSPEVNEAYQSDGYYDWDGAADNTFYNYRVKTFVDDGAGGIAESGWSQGAFQTAPPEISVEAPTGDFWLRGLDYYVRWYDNIVGDVEVELWMDGAFLESLGIIESMGVLDWEVSAGLTPGHTYSIKVTSIDDTALFGTSAADFSIINQPSIPGGTLHTTPDGQVQFGINVDGAAAASVYGSDDLPAQDWQFLQTVPLTDGNGVFSDDEADTMPGRSYYIQVP